MKKRNLQSRLDRRDELVLTIIALMIPLVTLPTMIGL